ncbi:MAG: NUDIX domain-containing protein [Patescibacteria group bacterium]|jgi:ADP-ribose pyrophosphatase YjhB (NUDIX family)
MKLLKTIRDTDLMIDSLVPTVFEERKAARAVVFDESNNVALLNVTAKHFHKLPGGGIEQGEDIEMALRREVLEEIGCAIENIRDLGIIEEYRNREALYQASYCFVADLVHEKGIPQLEDGEKADGFEPEWMSLEEAIETLQNELSVEDYEGKFIVLRDLTFLKEVSQVVYVN